MADEVSVDEPADDPLSGFDPIALPKRARSAAAGLGIVSAGAGGAAVFVADGDAGAIALLGIGTLMVLLALIGVVPRRIRAKDYEVEILRRREQTFQRTVVAAREDAPPALREAIDKFALEREDEIPFAARSVRLARDYESSIGDMVRQALDDLAASGLPKITAAAYGTDELVSELRGDFLLTTGERTVDIEVKASGIMVDDVYVWQGITRPGVRSRILVGPRYAAPVPSIAAEMGEVTVVCVRSIRDQPVLTDAIRRSLEPLADEAEYAR